MSIVSVAYAPACRNEILEEKIETQQGTDIDNKVNEVHKRVFVIRSWPHGIYKKPKDPRVKRAPVGVNGIVPIPSPVGIAHVEIGNPIWRHSETSDPGLNST
jgi:hypothetical protein